MSIFHSDDVMCVKCVELRVLSIERSLKFYVDILGLTIDEKRERRVLLKANSGNVIIELHEDPHALPLGITQGLYHYALLVEDRSALACMIKQCVRHRYPITGASDHGVSEAIYLDDPDGHGVEIYRDKQVSEWPVENDHITMYTKPLDLDAVMQTYIDKPYRVPNMILGHIHLHVPKLDDAKRFYSDVLGFNVVMYYMQSALFISDANYHHHIGLNTWHNDAPLLDTRQIGLISYTLHVPKIRYHGFMKRLFDAHVSVLTDEKGSYIVDILNQRIYLDVEKKRPGRSLI